MGWAAGTAGPATCSPWQGRTPRPWPGPRCWRSCRSARSRPSSPAAPGCSGGGGRSGWASSPGRWPPPMSPAGPPRCPGDLRTVAGPAARARARTRRLAVLPIGEIAAVVAGGAVLLWVWWPLGLGVLAGAVATAYVASRLAGPLSGRLRRAQHAAGVAASVAADFVAGLRVVAGFGASREATRRYERASRHALGTALSANVARAGLGGITEVVGGLFVVGTAMLAAHQTFAGRLTVGDLVIVVTIAQMLVGPMTMLGRN